MIRSAVLFLILVVTAPAGGVDDMAVRTSAFQQHYNLFFRALFGCPKKAREVEECDPKLGTIDYTEYLKAAHAAEDLFGLRR